MENLPIAILDIVVIILLLSSGLYSLVRGFTKEALSIGAWVGAVFATLYGFELVLPIVTHFINIPIVAEIVTGTLIFVVVLWLISMLINLFCSQIRESSLVSVDRFMGLIFGIVRGAILACIAWVFLFVFLIPEDSGWPKDVQRAKSRPLLIQSSAILIRLIPDRFQNGVMQDAIRASENAKKAYDSTRTYQQLLTPFSNQIDNSSELGYDQQSRKRLQRAIEAIVNQE